MSSSHVRNREISSDFSREVIIAMSGRSRKLSDLYASYVDRQLQKCSVGMIERFCLPHVLSQPNSIKRRSREQIPNLHEVSYYGRWNQFDPVPSLVNRVILEETEPESAEINRFAFFCFGQIFVFVQCASFVRNAFNIELQSEKQPKAFLSSLSASLVTVVIHFGHGCAVSEAAACKRDHRGQQWLPFAEIEQDCCCYDQAYDKSNLPFYSHCDLHRQILTADIAFVERAAA